MVRPPSGLFERKYRKKPQIVQSTTRAMYSLSSMPSMIQQYYRSAVHFKCYSLRWKRRLKPDFNSALCVQKVDAHVIHCRALSLSFSPLSDPIFFKPKPKNALHAFSIKSKRKSKVSGHTSWIWLTHLESDSLAFSQDLKLSELESMLWFDSIFWLKFVQERERFL